MCKIDLAPTAAPTAAPTPTPAPTALAVGQDCLGTGFTLYQGSNYFGCYQLFTTPVTADTAYANCNALGGWLGIPKNSDENYYMYNIRNDQVWIGYDDKVTEGTYVRQGDQSSSFTSWSSGKPSNEGKDCVFLYKYLGFFYRWGDDNVSDNHTCCKVVKFYKCFLTFFYLVWFDNAFLCV